MKIIADSGSTKTDWAVSDGQETEYFSTTGINPFFVEKEEIISILKNKLPVAAQAATEVYFYGAGCTVDRQPAVQKILQQHFTQARIEVESDLLGAARALCKTTAGIACILGTGSNSCVYDGKKIIEHIPPLGYILGDAGSGADIGKRFITALLRGKFPAEVSKKFFEENHLTPAEILEKVYREEKANRFLAEVAKNFKPLNGIIQDSFREFVKEQILPYRQARELPIHFVGGIAYNFQKELAEVLRKNRLSFGKIEKAPIVGLVEFHGFMRFACIAPISNYGNHINQ
jgi:hypothetical protein